jgi:hypothetical protein
LGGADCRFEERFLHSQNGDLFPGPGHERVGEHHDRHRLEFLMLADEFKNVRTAQFGNDEVQHDQIRFEFLNQFDGGHPVLRDEHVEPGVLEFSPVNPGDQDIILNKQNSSHASHEVFLSKST